MTSDPKKQSHFMHTALGVIFFFALEMSHLTFRMGKGDSLSTAAHDGVVPPGVSIFAGVILARSVSKGNDWPVSPLTSVIMFVLSFTWQRVMKNETDWWDLFFVALSIAAEFYYLKAKK